MKKIEVFLLITVSLLILECFLTPVVLLAQEDWDVAVRFDVAHKNPFYPFSAISGEVNKVYYARLTQTDYLYEEYVGRECCTKSKDVYMWKDFPSIYEEEGARRAKGWYVERKEISPFKYKILIRGVAWTDCDYSQEGYGYIKGELWVNEENGWKVTEVKKCNVQGSNKGQETYCAFAENKVRFAAGNNCGGCCACSDSAGLDIEVLLEKVQRFERWLE